MEQNEEIERQIWEFIDGTCNETDKVRISTLVATDAVWIQLYNELAILHSMIPEHLETEQPSMRFTQNVMEAVATTQIAPATKKYINKSIIRGIAAIFMIMLTAIFGYALATAHNDTNSTNLLPKLNLNNLNFNRFINSNTMMLFIAVNIVIGLVFFDTMLRRKRTQQTH